MIILPWMFAVPLIGHGRYQMRARFSVDQSGGVTVSYDAAFDVRVTRYFVCPLEGGYVQEYVNSHNNWSQVCDRLSSRGSTLRCSSRDNLLKLIRREYHAMRRANKESS
jgi:hypothetical protein